MCHVAMGVVQMAQSGVSLYPRTSSAARTTAEALQTQHVRSPLHLGTSMGVTSWHYVSRAVLSPTRSQMPSHGWNSRMCTLPHTTSPLTMAHRAI
jgi:hypothetical protein